MKELYLIVPFAPLIGAIVGDHGIINLTAYSVVKNEPY